MVLAALVSGHAPVGAAVGSGIHAAFGTANCFIHTIAAFPINTLSGIAERGARAIAAQRAQVVFVEILARAAAKIGDTALAGLCAKGVVAPDRSKDFVADITIAVAARLGVYGAIKVGIALTIDANADPAQDHVRADAICIDAGKDTAAGILKTNGNCPSAANHVADLAITIWVLAIQDELTGKSGSHVWQRKHPSKSFVWQAHFLMYSLMVGVTDGVDQPEKDGLDS